MPIRQIEVYEIGVKLKYDADNPNDEFGKLGDQIVDTSDVDTTVISREEFEREWYR